MILDAQADVFIQPSGVGSEVVREPQASLSGVKAVQTEASPVSLLTTVLWAAILMAGVVGIAVEPARPTFKKANLPPMEAELLSVDLTTEPVALPDEAPPSPSRLEPPPLVEPLTKPPVVPMTQVAAADAPVMFALPVTGPVWIVAAAKADFSRQAPVEAKPGAFSPRLQSIVYGQGEGRQEAPDYPRQAQRERQEGAVGVRFIVGRNGRVIESTLNSPCPWPLLNESALKVIRERWRFRSGELRAYEVFIRFQLRK